MTVRFWFSWCWKDFNFNVKFKWWRLVQFVPFGIWQLVSLTSYMHTLTLQCIYCGQFSLHFLWHWGGSVADHFLYSHDLNVWFSSDTVMWNSMLIIVKGYYSLSYTLYLKMSFLKFEWHGNELVRNWYSNGMLKMFAWHHGSFRLFKHFAGKLSHSRLVSIMFGHSLSLSFFFTLM